MNDWTNFKLIFQKTNFSQKLLFREAFSPANEAANKVYRFVRLFFLPLLCSSDLPEHETIQVELIIRSPGINLMASLSMHWVMSIAELSMTPSSVVKVAKGGRQANWSESEFPSHLSLTEKICQSISLIQRHHPEGWRQLHHILRQQCFILSRCNLIVQYFSVYGLLLVREFLPTWHFSCVLENILLLGLYLEDTSRKLVTRDDLWRNSVVVAFIAGMRFYFCVFFILPRKKGEKER